jgi:hypothetical protein
MLVTISWTPSNGTVTAKAQQPAAVPDLSRTSAHFVTPDTIAYPRASVPAGTDPTTLKYKLHWTTAGTLVIDIEDVVGGESALLAADPAGFTAEQVAAQPELADHIALRLDSKTARTVAREGGGAAGQMAVSQSTRLGALIDATGVDKAWCTTCRR